MMTEGGQQWRETHEVPAAPVATDRDIAGHAGCETQPWHAGDGNRSGHRDLKPRVNAAAPVATK